MSSPVSPLLPAEAPALRPVLWQLPLAAALLVVAVLGVGARFELVGFLYLAFVTGELCRSDITVHRLPNALVLPGLAFAAVGVVFGWLAGGPPPIGALAAALAIGAFFAMLNLAGGMGMGDVKLAVLLGLTGGAVGGVLVAGTLVLGFLAAGGVAVIRFAANGGGGSLAFGPYLLGGFWSSVALLAALA